MQLAESSLKRSVVLSVLRLFAAVHVLSLGLTALFFLGHQSPHHATLAVHVLLLVYVAVLSSTWVPGLRDSRPYVPVVLGVLLGVPLLGQSLALHQGGAAYQKMATELVLELVVPLVMVAWQQSYRAVVTLTLATGAVDVALALYAPIHAEQRDVFVHLLLSRTFGLLIVGYVVSRLVGEQRRQHQELGLAHAQLASHAASLESLTISRERNRMARELHDTLAHTLSAIAVQLEAARAVQPKDPEKSRTLLGCSCQTARNGLTEVRRALSELRATPLEDLGPLLAIRGLVEALAERTGVMTEMHLPDKFPELPATVEQGVYRIVQEALDNVERHAGATKVTLTLECSPERLVLRVTDDGQGFTPSAMPQGGYGLRGIRERALLLGGVVEVTSQPGAGTSIVLTVPVGA